MGRFLGKILLLVAAGLPATVTASPNRGTGLTQAQTPFSTADAPPLILSELQRFFASERSGQDLIDDDARYIQLVAELNTWARVNGHYLSIPLRLPYTASNALDAMAVTGRARTPFFSVEEQQRLRLVFKKGHIYEADGRTLFDTRKMKGGRAIFVMIFDGSFYAVEGVDGSVQHPSVVAGFPVAAAGEIEVHDGKLALFADKSGRYKPVRFASLQALHELEIRQGVSLEEVKFDLYQPNAPKDAKELIRMIDAGIPEAVFSSQTICRSHLSSGPTQPE